MATLKSVLHHFNKALKEYDTLHPETEVAQIVDLLPTINAAINGSSVTWDGKKFTNNALGITGLIDTNGYVAFGPNFGGLIIQWGKSKTGNSNKTILLNVKMSNSDYSVLAQNIGNITSTGYWQVSDASTSSFKIYNTFSGNGINWYWFVIGK